MRYPLQLAFCSLQKCVFLDVYVILSDKDRATDICYKCIVMDDKLCYPNIRGS